MRDLGFDSQVTVLNNSSGLNELGRMRVLHGRIGRAQHSRHAAPGTMCVFFDKVP